MLLINMINMDSILILNDLLYSKGWDDIEIRYNIQLNDQYLCSYHKIKVIVDMLQSINDDTLSLGLADKMEQMMLNGY